MNELNHLANRVAGSKSFDCVWEFVEEEMRLLAPEGRDRFWQRLREKVEERFPPAIHDRDKPMGHHESLVFGATGMPFGQYQAYNVASHHIPIEYLIWLSEQKFTDDLRRFLKTPEMQRKIAEHNRK